MKKTFTANLNGTVFHIEEDAYDQLQRYLANIRAKFSGSAEAEEIMTDIEARIAELFHERLQGRQAVSMADVDHVKQVMGQPEDYVDGDTEEQTRRNDNSSYKDAHRTHKRLYRDLDDRWVGGVISGIANYFGMEPLWFRIGAIVLLVAGWGSPVLIYFILWAFVPAANTAAEHLEMHGEPVTVDNIKRVFEEGAERMKAGGERVAREAREFGSNWGPRSRGVGTRAADVFTKLIGVVLVLFSISLLIGLLTALVGGSASLWQATWSNDHIGVIDLGGYLFSSTTQALWSAVALFLVFTLPVIGMLLAGIRLISGAPASRWLNWSITLVWLVALVLLIITSFKLANDFRRTTTVRSEAALAQPAGDMLVLDMLVPEDSVLSGWGVHYKHGHLDLDLDGIHVENGRISGAWGELDVQPSPDSLFHLVVFRQARAATVKGASSRAENIGFNYRQAGDVLQLSPLVHFSVHDKFRVQEVRFIVLVPQGKSVYFKDATAPMLDDIENTTNTYDLDMVGHTWTMTAKGLEIMDPAGTDTMHSAPDPIPVPPSPAKPPTPPSAATIQTPAMDQALPNLFQLLTSAIRV